MTTQPRLGLQFMTGADVNVVRVQGTVATALGGKLDRATNYTAQAANGLGVSHGAKQAPNGKVYARHCDGDGQAPYVTEFFPTALKIYLTGDPVGGTPVKGDTVTGDTSGATGTLIEDYQAGDNFVKFVPTSGTFQDGENVTFSGTETATLTGSGNPESNGGEHGETFVGSFTVDTGGSVPMMSGIHQYVRSDGKIGLAFMYKDNASSTTVRGCVWDPNTELWSDILITTSAVNFVRSGPSYSRDGVIHWRVGTQTNPIATNGAYIVAWNPGTNSYAQGVLSGTLSDWRHNIVEWNGDLYTMSATSSFGVEKPRLYRVTGGSVVLVDEIPQVTANWNRTYNLTVGQDDNALYCFSSRSGVARIARWHLDEDNNVVRDSIVSTGDTDGIENAVAAPSLQSGLSGLQHYTNFMDLETTPGSVTHYFWMSDNAAAAKQYQYVPWTNLDGGSSASYVSTGAFTAEITFSADPALAVGDWVRNVTTNQAFRVTAINVGGDPKVIEVTGNSDSGNAPGTGSAVWQKANQWTEISASGGQVGVAITNDLEGNGGDIFTTGERHIGISNVIGLPGAEQLSYVPRSDTGTDNVTIAGYFMTKDRTYGQMTLQNPSEGSVSGQTIINVTANNAEKTVEWDSDGDGAPSEVVRRWLRIFT